jgi:hypothetical protein
MMDHSERIAMHLREGRTVSGGHDHPAWQVKVAINGLGSDQVFALLNTQSELGNTTVLYAPCSDGNFLFFGNYSYSEE